MVEVSFLIFAAASGFTANDSREVEPTDGQMPTSGARLSAG